MVASHAFLGVGAEVELVDQLFVVGKVYLEWDFILNLFLLLNIELVLQLGYEGVYLENGVVLGDLLKPE